MLLTSALALAGAAFGAANGKSLPPSTPDFDFVALGDNRPVGAGMPPTPVFKSILADVANIGPAFVLSSGDIVFGKSEPIATYRSECTAIQALIDKLPCPFYNAPGNHEISERKDLYAEYRKRFGATYGSFKFGDWKFIEVSTEEVGFSPAVAPTEMTWLKKALAGPEPKMVFHHHPLYHRETNTEARSTVANHDEVEAAYEEGNVKYVFSGHDHVFNHQTHNGIEYYITGGAGAPLDAPPAEGGYFHYLIVHVRGEDVEIDPIPAGAIQVTPIAGGLIVGNYSDFPIHFHRLAVPCQARPSGFEVTSVKKKVAQVKVTVMGGAMRTNGYTAYLDLIAAPHAPTIIKVRP